MEIERALHSKYDAYMSKRAPGRKPYFVFSKNGSEIRRASVIRKIRSERSNVIG
jgi:hypothetical protein